MSDSETPPARYHVQFEKKHLHNGELTDEIEAREIERMGGRTGIVRSDGIHIEYDTDEIMSIDRLSGE